MKMDITAIYDVALITLRKIPNTTPTLRNIFQKIGDNGINVDMISQTMPLENLINLSFTINNEDMGEVVPILASFKEEIAGIRVDVHGDCAKLSIYNEKMIHMPGVAAKAFSALAETDIKILAITTSEVDISLLFEQKDVDRAEEILKNYFKE